MHVLIKGSDEENEEFEMKLVLRYCIHALENKSNFDIIQAFLNLLIKVRSLSFPTSVGVHSCQYFFAFRCMGRY